VKRLAALVLLATLFPLAGLGLDYSLSRYSRQSWRINNGLPQNTVHAILQTHDGYLWLATEGGLVRFDGLTFLVHDSQNTPELKSNNIRCLLEDRKQALWIGTAAGLARLSGGKFSAFTMAQGLPSNNIWSLYQDHSGKVWVITSEGLASLESGRFHSEAGTSGVNAMAQDTAGSLWVGTQDGLKRLHGADETASTSSVQTLLADNSGGVWVGTPDGLLYAKDGIVKRKYTKQDGLPGNRIAALLQDRQGRLWISTDGSLARLANDRIERFPDNETSPVGGVLSIYQDREGSLWLGTEADGLQLIRDQKFATYTSEDGLSSDLTRCVFQDRHGTIWMGTDNGLNQFQNKTFSNLTTKNGLSSNVILALAEDAAGNLLVGTPDGLDVLEGGKVKVYTSADGLADDFVRSLYLDVDGSLWIGARHGLSHWVSGSFKTYTEADGLGSDVVGALLRDRKGSLWIGTLHGLTRLKDGKFQNFTMEDGLSDNTITALHEDEDGVLWIGTQHGGLDRFVSGRFVSRSASRYWPDLSAAIGGILEDAEGNLWIASQTGIFRIGKRRANMAPVQYGVADGLVVSECSEGGHPSVWKGQDGSLWFATVKGVATIDPSHAQLNSLPPPVVIEQVLIDGQAFHPGPRMEAPPGRSRLSFEYAGLSFVTPQKLKFKYRLDGFDRDWVDAGMRRTAYYTNIPPGHYHFRVIASNADGVWNEAGASQSLWLRPHFYQTYWFYLTLPMMAALLAYALYTWRLKHIEAQFDAVLAERNRIAREIHDTLAQGFVAVSVQLEVISRLLPTSIAAADEMLGQTRTLVQSSLAEARRSIWKLRSQNSYQEDLASQLTKMTEQVTAATQLKTRFQVAGPYRKLPERVESELLKIGQEAVTNVVRHSGARNVEIDLHYDARKLTMTISDDGRGFGRTEKAAGPEGHFGLQGMRERAAQIGAELTVKSAPGQGTQVSVETVVA
jgi:ligand-binding sensor domain-containing protein/two-component sensor histidine kinase